MGLDSFCTSRSMEACDGGGGGGWLGGDEVSGSRSPGRIINGQEFFARRGADRTPALGSHLPVTVDHLLTGCDDVSI